MYYMIAGLVLFFGPHLVSTLPKFRAMKVRILGENGYKMGMSLFSLAGLALLAYGKSDIAFKHLYMPINELRHAMGLIMWISFFLLASAHARSNVKRLTRHPMLWGIVLWSAGHLTVNGDLGSLLLFGPFLVYSIWAMISANMRGAKKATSFPSWKKDAGVAVVTLALTVGVMFAHGWLFGVRLF